MANITVEEKLKLKRVLQLLKQKINDKRVMWSENLSQLCTWVDAVYDIHPNLKIHTSGGMSFVYRLLHYKYSKQKLNTKSSTEAKVVGVSDYLPYNICICLFMEAHRYNTKQNILFQYNQSATRMENIGNKSYSGNSRHIDINYLFVKYFTGHR